MKVLKTSSALILLLSIAVILLFNLGISTQKRSITKPYSVLSISGPIKVILDNTPEDQLVIRADTRLHKSIVTEVNNDTLYIYPNGRIQRERVLQIRLPAEKLQSLSASGASEVFTYLPLRGKSISVQMSGAVDAKLRVEADSLILISKGASNAYLAGKVAYFKPLFEGYGDLVAYNLEATKVALQFDCPPQNPGIARIQVRDSLWSTINCSRHLYYKGAPRFIEKSLSKEAKVIPL